MFHRISALCASLGLLLLLCSCSETVPEDFPHPGRTVVAYLAADNDLAGETEARIAALAAGRRGARGGELLIYTDSPSGARLLRVLPDGSTETVAVYGTENSASAEVLGRVLREVQVAYPSDGYGLLFFSHGSGWLPQGALQNPCRGRLPRMTLAAPASRSVGWDDKPEDVVPGESPHEEMELEAFVAAIPDGFLDFIAFEACLMAGAEVAYALRDKADCMLASSAELLSPGFTPVYEGSLKYLLDASRPAAECLTAFGQAYMRHVETLQGVYRSATLSVVELKEMEALAARTAGLLPLSVCESDITADLQHFDRPGSYGDLPAVARYFDLEACALRAATPVQSAALREQLERTVVWQAHTGRFMVAGDDYLRYNGFDIETHSGLTVYVPREGLETLNEAYRRTAWCRAIDIRRSKTDR